MADVRTAPLTSHTQRTSDPDHDAAHPLDEDVARAVRAHGVRTSTLSALPSTPVFRPADTGVSLPTLRRLVRAGIVERVGHGLYRRADAPLVDLDLAEVAVRSPHATLCLTSALAHHDLVTAVPERHDIALPRGHASISTPAPVVWHSFDAPTFHVGRSLTPVDASSLQIGLYSPERSIADAFRLRHQVGHEIAIEALRSWLRRSSSSPAELMRVASQLPRARRPVSQALAVLL